MVKPTETRRIRCNGGIMENAPYWIDTPLDQLPFEWSPEDKLEIERYCEKIHQNIDEEEMTPRERWEATMAGKPRDRLLIQDMRINAGYVRTLDSFADALKVGDIYRSPKLLVKGTLATVARFKLDLPIFYTLSYNEEIWGQRSRIIDYGHPVVVGDTPINTAADLEGIEIPDPYKDGLYPGYLWGCREIRRIFDEYGLTKVMPLWMSHCGSCEGSMMFMIGMAKFVKALTRDPELCKRSTAMNNEFAIRFGKAVREVGRPDMCFLCVGPDLLPLKGNEWIIPLHVELSKALTPSAPICIGASYISILDWLSRYYEQVGSDGYAGGFFVYDIDITKVVPYCREHNLYACCTFSEKIMLDGPISAIEEAVKEKCEYGKPYSKFVIGYTSDYWTPAAHYDAAIAACKKYGKY